MYKPSTGSSSETNREYLKNKATRYRISYRDRNGDEKTAEQLQHDIDVYEAVLSQAVRIGINFRHPDGKYKSLNVLRDTLDDYDVTRKLAQEYNIPVKYPNGTNVSLYRLREDIHQYELKFVEEEYMPSSCSNHDFKGFDSDKRVAVYILDQSALNLLVVHEKVIPISQRRIGVPKGKIKIDEPSYNAFYRETCEEIGLDLDTISHEILEESNKKLVVMLHEDWNDVPVFRGREIFKIEWLDLAWLINDIKENPHVYNYSLRSEIGMLRRIYDIVISYQPFKSESA